LLETENVIFLIIIFGSAKTPCWVADIPGYIN